MIYFLFLFVSMIIIQILVIVRYKKIIASTKLVIASVTHDLKNPIIAQINMLNLLLNGKFGDLNAKQYEMLKLTFNASNYMFTLVNNILLGYESESTNFHLYKSKFDIIRLIKDICDDNISLCTQKNQTVKLNYSMPECFIYADKLQIKRVISNLLSNAINYGNSNSSITINLLNKDDIVDFSVSNKSSYISPKELKKIFDKFAKTSSNRLNKASSGLGLYIVKKIVSMHKGEIYAQSEKDGVCTFGFRIKLQPENQNIQKV